jgi:hypothetical protein
MRTAKTTLFAFVVVALVAGCGDDSGNGSGDGGNGSGDAGTAGGFDVDKLLRACTILHSCLNYYDISGCVFDFNRHGTPAQVDCVLAASVADCSAANACIGAKLAPDTNCVERCLDDRTFVRCNGPSMHTEMDCAKSLQSGGPQCITSQTSAGCGVAACSAEGEFTCDGMVSHHCGSGIERMQDCSRIGAQCIASNPGCVQPTPGPCTTQWGCDGDRLFYCDSTGAQRIEDCTKTIPDGTCIIVDNFTACGWAAQCNVQNTADSCLGTTLRSCVLGAIKDVECTAVGGTTCMPNPNTPGALCSL